MASNAANLESVKTRVSRIESMHYSPSYSDHYHVPHYSLSSKHSQFTSTPSPAKPLSHKYVKLNIGGMLYVSTLDTLTREDSMLRAMFSGRMNMDKDEEGNSIVTVRPVVPTWDPQDLKICITVNGSIECIYLL